MPPLAGGHPTPTWWPSKLSTSNVLILTAEQVLMELARIGFSDIRQLFDEQNVLRPIHSLDEQTAAIIASFEQDALFSESGKIGVTKKVKLWDKVQVLTTLARHFQLLEPKQTKRPLKIIIADAPALGPRVVNGSDSEPLGSSC